MYSLGFAIGTEGIGKDDIQSAALLFKTPGLRLEHVESVAIRLTSVGTFGGLRNASLKLTGATPAWILTPCRNPRASGCTGA